MTGEQKLYEELLDRYGAEIAKAFMSALDDLRAKVDLGRIIAAIQAGDLDAAVAAMNLDPAAFNDMLDAIARAYAENGKLTVEALPTLRDAAGIRVVVRFDGRNARAEAWLRSHSSELVTRVLDDQRNAIRARLTEGMAAGENPRTTALDIVGRVDPGSGRREGGILGLTPNQAMAVSRARSELRSEDSSELRAYLKRARRDKRYDRSVRKAIETEKPLPADIARKAVVAYERRLLQLRGETIGRSESLSSLNAAQDEALRQLVDSGVSPSQVRRVWKSAGDFRVRHTHRMLNGEAVGLNEPFRSPAGAVLRFPGDPSAPAAERINCRCWLQPRIDVRPNRA